MTTITCPNCGKPLRPGARFCGSCGHVLSASSAAQAMPAPADANTIPCPQCGKPVRVGAKFCNNCGAVLQKEGTPPPAPSAETPASGPTLKQPPAPAMAAPAVVPAAGGGQAPAMPRTKSGAGRKIMWPLIVIALVVLCGLVGGGAYVYLKDPFGWFAASTASPTVLTPSQTPELAPTMAATKVEISTQNPPTSTLNPTAEPVVVTTITSTLELSPTIQPSPEISITGVTQPAVDLTLLVDDFNGPLNVNWKSWGSPRPIIRSGPGDNWLELTATDKPDTSGVTSRAQIPSAAGNVIEFQGQLNPNYANFPLLLDWDPLQFDRGPENTTLTVMHLSIQSTRVVLSAPAANNSCQKESDGTKQHSYVLKFIAEKKVELYIDGIEPALCQLDLGIMAIPGRITFTGTGWVTRIIVTGSNLP
jgi:hypothetical protein